MANWDVMFQTVFSATKEIFEANKSFLFKVAIILAILTTISPILNIIYSPVDDIASGNFDDVLISDGETGDISFNSTNANIISLVNIIISLGVNIFYTVLFIFFFYLIVKQNKSLGQSFSYFVSKLVPLIGTHILFLILIIPLYLLFIIPGIIFSIYWMFFLHALLFRDKSFFSALKYSKLLVNDKKSKILGDLWDLFLNLVRYWLPMMFLSVPLFFTSLFSYFTSSVTSIFITAILHLIIGFLNSLMLFYGVIFSVRYFLELEKQRGISNELLTITSAVTKSADGVSSISQSEQKLSQNEASIKNYIETYKSEYPRDAIRRVLVNSVGHSLEEVDTCLDKYY